MSAVLMDGKALSAKVRGEILEKARALTAAGTRPGLAVILVGEDPASQVYVRNKEKACAECGFYSEKYVLPADQTVEIKADETAELTFHNALVPDVPDTGDTGLSTAVFIAAAAACGILLLHRRRKES